MTRMRGLFALFIGLAASTIAASGEAYAVDVVAPFGSAPATGWIGMSNGQAVVVWERHGSVGCAITVLGGSSGLDNDYQIIGSPGGGALVVLGGVFGQIGACGRTVDELHYNGHWLDITGQSGADRLYTGIGDTWAAGNGGNDDLHGFTPIGRLMGGGGKDKLVGGSAISTDQLEGNDGDDCLLDFGNAHLQMDCGSHDVQDYFEAGGSQANCEVDVDSWCPTSGWR